MDLRTASRQINEKELKPFLLEAIKRHPRPVDFKIIRGNIVTARDYARRFLVRVRKEGIADLSAEQFNRLKPSIRVYINDQGLTFAGFTKKTVGPSYWDNYKFPFEIMRSEDARWTTLAVNPTETEIKFLFDLMTRGVLPAPIEVRTKFTVKEIQAMTPGAHVFLIGKNRMIWPRKQK